MTDSVKTLSDMIYNYSELFDTGDFDGFAAQFEHGRWHRAEPGTAATRQWIADHVQVHDGLPRTKHVITNLIVDVDEDAGTATSRSYITVWQAVPPELPLQAVFSGRYRRPVRTGGRRVALARTQRPGRPLRRHVEARPMSAPTSNRLSDGQLVLAHHCLRAATFEERVEAAAAGGFAAIGFNVRDYGRLREEGRTPAQLRAVLEANGVMLGEIETVLGWDLPMAERTEAMDAREALVFEMADEFGSRHLVAVASINGPLGPEPVEGFGRLCDRAVAHDLLVALEPQACSAVTDLDLALSIVRGAGRLNGGINIDVWHLTRGGWGIESLSELRAEEVVVVQLDDGPAEPVSEDYLEDTTRYRQAPGEGEFDLAGFVRALDAVGVRAPVSLEVISDELDQLPPAEVGRRLGDGTRSVLAAAGVTFAAG